MGRGHRIMKEGHSKRRMLTAKQEKFVRELVKGKSQREAYKAAYNASKMKEATIDNKAYQLFKKDEIRARYDELNNKVAEKTVYDVAEIRRLIIDTELAILKADATEEVNGIAVKDKRFDRFGNKIYTNYDKQEAIKVLREMLGIDMTGDENGIHIHLHGVEDYDA